MDGNYFIIMVGVCWVTKLGAKDGFIFHFRNNYSTIRTYKTNIYFDVGIFNSQRPPPKDGYNIKDFYIFLLYFITIYFNCKRT